MVLFWQIDEFGLRSLPRRNFRVTPRSGLRAFQILEILTSENAKPNSNWLDYATTARARSKIKSSLKEDKKRIGEDGKEILRRKLKQLKITLNEKNLVERRHCISNLSQVI